MNEEARKLGNLIARQLYAMVAKKKELDPLEASRNAKYQRTFTDEYLFARKPRPAKPIPEDAKQNWALMAGRWK